MRMSKSNEHFLPVIRSAYGETANNQDFQKYADLHIHTRYSDGILVPEEAVEIALAVGLQAIAITDHDVYYAWDKAYGYAQRNGYDIEIIRAVELSTTDGHLLAYNVQDDVASGLSLLESIKEIHRQGGLAVAAHPGLPHVSSISLEKILQIISTDDPELYFDGIEIFNATGVMMQRLDKIGLFFGRSQQKLNQFVIANSANPKLGAVTSGTDAHTRKLGAGVTAYSCESVLESIQLRETTVMRSDPTFTSDISEAARMVYSIVRAKLVD